MVSPCVRQLVLDALEQDYAEEQIDETLRFLSASGVKKVAQLSSVRESEVIGALDQAKASLGLRSAVHRIHAWAMVEEARKRYMPTGPSYRVVNVNRMTPIPEVPSLPARDRSASGLSSTSASPRSNTVAVGGTSVRLPIGKWTRSNSMSTASESSVSGLSTESPAGWASRVDQTPGTNVSASGWAAQVNRDRTFSQDTTDENSRKAAFIPTHGSEEDTQRWQFSISREPNATVGELRKKISSHIKVPMGKIRLARAGHYELKDTDFAAEASELFIYSTPDGHSQDGNRTPLTRRKAMALQQDFLTALESYGCGRVPTPDKVSTPDREEISGGYVSEGSDSRHMKDRIKHAQAKVLPSYGFGTDVAGVFAMLRAFDAFAEDAEVTRMGDRINKLVGARPQMYNIEDLCADDY